MSAYFTYRGRPSPGLDQVPMSALLKARDQLQRSEKRRWGRWSYRLDDSARLAVIYAVRYVMEVKKETSSVDTS